MDGSSCRSIVSSAPALSARVRGAPASSTVRIADIAADMRRRGQRVVDLSAGRAAEHTPAFIAEAASRALLGGDTHQTAARGRPEFRRAAAAKLARDNGVDADPDTRIMATLGCKQGLTLALLATLDPGDEVIVEDPGFVSYAPTVRFCGGVPVTVPLRANNGFRWRRDELEAAVTSRTRAILFCSPQNPTGAVHTAEELEQVADVARRRDLVVISDEIYERAAWGGRRHISMATLPAMAERTIALMGLTKTYSMGGWRIGFALAPPVLLEGMVTLQQHLMTCAGSFSQIGAAEALGAEAPPELQALWRDWEARCRYMTRALDRLPGAACAMPEGGFYAWTDVRALGLPSVKLSERLLREEQVATVPGSSFGPHGEGYVRITCVRSWEELREGAARLERAFARHAREAGL